MSVTVRPMEQRDVVEATRICSLAFGTFVGHPKPLEFFGDLDFFRSRFGARNTAAFVAESDGRLVGSNLVTRWGSVGFFGPLSVHPEAWEGGIGKSLLVPTMRQFDEWGVAFRGLYTFAQSPKHVGLYYKHGFHPRFLTPVMGARVDANATASGWRRFSDVANDERNGVTAGVRKLTDAIFAGLDVTDEMVTVAERALGDTVILETTGVVTGVAICHVGPGTEAGSDTCYMKFGGVAPGKNAAVEFRHLLDAVEAFAASRGLQFMSAGVNTAREQAYKIMLDRGFKTRMQGVIMHSPNVVGYSTPDSFVLDDWR